MFYCRAEGSRAGAGDAPAGRIGRLPRQAPGDAPAGTSSGPVVGRPPPPIAAAGAGGPVGLPCGRIGPLMWQLGVRSFMLRPPMLQFGPPCCRSALHAAAGPPNPVLGLPIVVIGSAILRLGPAILRLGPAILQIDSVRNAMSGSCRPAGRHAGRSCRFDAHSTVRPGAARRPQPHKRRRNRHTVLLEVDLHESRLQTVHRVLLEVDLHESWPALADGDAGRRGSLHATRALRCLGRLARSARSGPIPHAAAARLMRRRLGTCRGQRRMRRGQRRATHGQRHAIPRHSPRADGRPTPG